MWMSLIIMEMKVDVIAVVLSGENSGNDGSE